MQICEVYAMISTRFLELDLPGSEKYINRVEWVVCVFEAGAGPGKFKGFIQTPFDKKLPSLCTVKSIFMYIF